ncbi:hypothetical protein COHA_008212 [Chlorella ohadii]|uniref:Uncharacterized protein n=1 Tax=Chlorella ohadii TaxID=2649997 RepID=A0AAD5DJD4_9CHLO|nr:hypothetical protein COHA_008212 [Chlorella ohadii]
MAALALLNLGSAALRQYPPPSASEVTAALQDAAHSSTTMAALLHQAYTASAAAVLLTVGNIGGLILWGAGIWWLVIVIISVARTAHCMHFVIGWWGFVFPAAVFSSAANTLWKQLPGMRALRPVSAALICCCIALWGMCSALTLFHCYNGSLLYTPCMNRFPWQKDIPESHSQVIGSISDQRRQDGRQLQAGQGATWGRAGGQELELHPYGEP